MSEENWRDNSRGISSFTCSKCKQVVGTYLGYRKHLVECEKVGVNKEVQEKNWKVVIDNTLKCVYCGYIPSDYIEANNHNCGYLPAEYIDTNTDIDNKQLKLDLDEEIVEEESKIDKIDLTRDIVDYRDKLESEAIKNTPNVYHTSYYKLGKEDLYSIFIKKFGFQSWLRHVEMECIQYLWRAKDKGVYKEDINKVKVICERILAELKESS